MEPYRGCLESAELGARNDQLGRSEVVHQLRIESERVTLRIFCGCESAALPAVAASAIVSLSPLMQTIYIDRCKWQRGQKEDLAERRRF